MRGTRKDYETPTREQVEGSIKKFLNSPQRGETGGFAEVKETDEEELSKIIRALIKFRYPPDADGDRPIKWQLCDWTRKQPHYFRCLPTTTSSRFDDDLAAEEEAYNNALDVALLNLSLVTRDIETCRTMLREIRQEKKEKTNVQEG